MKEYIHQIFSRYHVLITMGIVCLVVAIIGFGEYRNYQLKKLVANISDNLVSTNVVFESSIKRLDDKINSIVTQNKLLDSMFQTELIKNANLADQVQQVNDTAVTLEKLSKVDPQLLQKYSKTFFLNEHYEPADLITIPEVYTYEKDKEYQFYADAQPYLIKMLKAASGDDIDLLVISAYRSFGSQATLKSAYQVIYGAGTANQFSADQGYSEHQLGTTIDITTPELKDSYSTFDKTKAYTWLTNNAYKYGFTLSYPKDNAYYVFEPWHWRFVGEDLANRLHRKNQYFYDLDQRTINNYLSVLFD